ncbi:MAG: heavy metal-binding domain-containing protein [Acidimicrobiales bacterium]
MTGPGPHLGSAADAALADLRHPPNHAASSTGGRAVTSSDLSVDEDILVREAGFEALGLVSGAAVFHIGMVGMMQGMGNAELSSLSQAMYQARESAVGRLVAAGERLGGTGVVGVRLDIEMFEHRSHLAQFVAFGTAIADRDPKRAAGAPFFTSDLSGQDLYLLNRAGYRPVGLVMGSCVYHVARQGFGRWASGQTQNQEMTTYTEALYEARELAMGRLQDEAIRVGADGVVGVQTSERSHVWGSHVIEFFTLGTGVRLTSDQHRRIDPRPVVPLDDPVVATDPGAVIGSGAVSGD